MVGHDESVPSRPTPAPGPSIVVVGSVNLDLVALLPRLPTPGETVAAHRVTRLPGGKGANQALAARRLGASVRLVAAVGTDETAEQALALLRAEHVDLSRLRTVDTLTGLALVEVDDAGETTIVVAPGANAELRVRADDLAGADAVLTVLEVPDEAVAAAVEHAPGFVALNAAPARPVPPKVLRGADLVVVNRTERDGLGEVPGLLAVTMGAAGAVLLRGGREVARATPPPVRAVDGTGAGDAFCAALVLGLVTGRTEAAALHRACVAGALAASRPGAQAALPWAEELGDTELGT